MSSGTASTSRTSGQAGSCRRRRARPNGHDGEAHGGHGIHLPSPSYWPFVAALAMPIMAYGVLYSWWLFGAGVLVNMVGLYAWAMEPSVASEDG